MRRRLGFTLVESIASLSIVAILTSLLMPVLVSARERAKIGSSLARLRNLHGAVMLYQGDHDSGGRYGEGLPSYGYVYTTYLGLGRDFFRSPCGYKPGIESNEERLSYQYADPEGSNEEAYYSKYKENVVLFRDPHCNSPDAWNADLRHKRGLGVTLGGQLLNLNKTGPAWRNEWWTLPHE